jgi:protein-disulfide isomerase
MESSLARLSLKLAVSTILLASAAFAQTSAPETAPAGAPVVQPEPKPFVYTPKEDDIVVGVPSAKVTLVEYASLSCPHCAHFHNDVLPELKKKYIDFGNLRVVFRHFPLNGSALSGAITVNCVPTNERQKYLKVLFATQDKWAFDSNYKDAISNIVNVGGLTKERFEACQNDKKIEEAIILVRKEAGEMSWVNSTPTFFINGKKFEGEKTIEDFSKAIDPLLK